MSMNETYVYEVKFKRKLYFKVLRSPGEMISSGDI